MNARQRRALDRVRQDALSTIADAPTFSPAYWSALAMVGDVRTRTSSTSLTHIERTH